VSLLIERKEISSSLSILNITASKNPVEGHFILFALYPLELKQSTLCYKGSRCLNSV